MYILISLYLLTVIGLTPGGSSTVHIYTQTIHRTTQLTNLIGRLSGIRTQSSQTKINITLIKSIFITGCVYSHQTGLHVNYKNKMILAILLSIGKF